VGRAYYDRCVQILADIEQADDIAGALQSTPRGTLRIYTATHIVQFVSPVVAEFLALYPEVKVDLTMGERAIDMIDEGFDIAVRLTPPPGPVRRAGTILLERSGVELVAPGEGVIGDVFAFGEPVDFQSWVWLEDQFDTPVPGTVSFAARDLEQNPPSFVQRQINLVILSLFGLYAANFLSVLLASLLPVDTLSGEIDSGVMQTLASKPVRRSDIVLGKWLGFGAVIVTYFLALAAGVLIATRWVAGYQQLNLGFAIPLMLLELVVMHTISIAGGTARHPSVSRV